MTNCETMKKGEVYTCTCCGFEIEVKNECNCATGDACETHTHDHACCDFKCCGKTLELKK